MLAVLGGLELGDMHQLNAVKNVLAMAINAASALLFTLGSLSGRGDVAWPEAAVMAGAAVVGGLHQGLDPTGIQSHPGQPDRQAPDQQHCCCKKEQAIEEP